MKNDKKTRLALVLGCVIAYAFGGVLFLSVTGCDDDGGSGSVSSAPSQTVSTDALREGEPTTPPSPPVVPVPGALVLTGIGVASIVWLRRHRKV